MGGLAILLGVIGFLRVTAEPTEDITFVIEDDLPFGITQESVEYVMETRGFAAYEPFTFHVTARELEPSEIYDGDIGDADILFSVGDDETDRDLVLEDSSRVAFSGEDSGADNHSIATEIRSTFNNNRTMGHGPSAVVGAAITAADLKYPGPNQSVVWWLSLSVLPMFAAVWVMACWLRDRRQERAWQRRYTRARWQLAHTVLELDALEVRYETAQSPELAPLWEGIRHDSLALAQTDQELEPRYATPGYIPPGQRAQYDATLEDFEAAAEALIQRVDALAGGAEVRAGHMGSRSVLDRIAQPIVQAIDELLARRQHAPKLAAQLATQRDRLLALSQQVSQDDDAEAEQLNREHHQVLENWRIVEDQIRTLADQIETQIRSEHIGLFSDRDSEQNLQEAAEQRLRRRIAAITVGHQESLARLRAALELGHGITSGPGYALERVLEILDTQQLRSTAVTTQTAGAGRTTKRNIAAAIGLIGPVAAGLIGGWIAVAAADVNTAYGRELTGDTHLQDLNIFGDPQLLPTLEDRAQELEDEPELTNIDLLTLEEIRDGMQRSVDHGGEMQLLPDALELTLAIVPIQEYTDYERSSDLNGRLAIDYADVLSAHDQLKHDVAQHRPALLDPNTGEIALGQALQPVWVLPDDTYALGGIMTGEISWGIDSQLGTYYFSFTEPRILGTPDDTLLTVEHLAYELHELGRNMEYNHQHAATHDPGALYWTVALAVWAAIQTLLLGGVALVATSRRFENTQKAREQLADLQRQLEQLTIGLDMTRLDMVAVLGAQSVSSTGGDAELAAQRLYESTLVTAWRQVQDLQETPRREQRGDVWLTRVGQVQRLVDIMTTRELTVTQRAAAVLQHDANSTDET